MGLARILLNTLVWYILGVTPYMLLVHTKKINFSSWAAIYLKECLDMQAINPSYKFSA